MAETVVPQDGVGDIVEDPHLLAVVHREYGVGEIAQRVA